MADEKRIKLARVKCPACKLSLIIKASLKVCPRCRGPLARRQKV